MCRSKVTCYIHGKYKAKSTGSLQMEKTELKEDRRTIILHFAYRPEVPYEVDFSRSSFYNKSLLGPLGVSMILFVFLVQKSP